MENILHQINKASLKFLSSQTIDEVYKTIIDEALRLVNAEYGTIFLHEDGELKNVFSSPGFEDLVVRKRGYTYDAFKKNIPLLLQDNKILNVHPVVKKMKVRSILFIPLSYEDKSIGVLTIRSTTSKQFTKKQFEVLKIFGSMASLAIRKTQLTKETKEALESKTQYQQMEKVMERVYKAGLKFLVPQTLEETYETIVNEAKRLVRGEYGSVLLYKDGQFERVYASHPALQKIVPRPRGHMYSVYKKKKSVILLSREIRSIHPEIDELDTKSDILIPLSNRGRSIGVLSIQSKRRNFTEHDLSVIQLFGSMASLAIRKTQLSSELEKALEIRDLFIALAAHELRTPLTTINGYIHLLHRKLSGRGNIESKWSKQLLWESQRMTYLVNELLEINKIKGGKFQYNLHETSIKAILERTVNNFKFSHPKRILQYIYPETIKHDIIVADFDKILQVLTNLLDNAVKFSASDTPVRLSLGYKNGDFVITVEDKGRGIPKKEQPRVFQEFYKGEGNTEKGMGLGLYLAKDIITAHHGKISFKTQSGHGTVMTIKLPTLTNSKRRHTDGK